MKTYVFFEKKVNEMKIRQKIEKLRKNKLRFSRVAGYLTWPPLKNCDAKKR